MRRKLNDLDLKPLDMSHEMKSKVLEMRRSGVLFDVIACEIGCSKGGAVKIYKAAGGQLTNKKKKAKSLTKPRVAYSYQEFADLCGKDRTWVYRQVAKGQLRSITGFGAAMIPSSEIERVFGHGCMPHADDQPASADESPRI